MTDEELVRRFFGEIPVPEPDDAFVDRVMAKIKDLESGCTTTST